MTAQPCAVVEHRLLGAKSALDFCSLLAAPMASALTLVVVLVLFQSQPAHAQTGSASSAARATAKPPTEQGLRWSELKPAQQAALKPLEREWPVIEANRKQTWLEMAAKFPTIPPAEQARVQDRMAEWVRLTPQQRGMARLRFQELKELPPQDRQARWNAYQALSPEQRQQFVERAMPDPVRKPAPGARADAADALQRKSSIVPSAGTVGSSRSVAATLIQARPGATTSLVTKRPAPPMHQQAGLPKITATPDAINKSTLLPQRGPQGARAAPAAVPASRPATAQ